MSAFQCFAKILLLILSHISLLQCREHFSKYHSISFPLSLRREASSQIKSMFNFGFDNYMKYAFPHDELKPLSGSYTDSLPELGNAKNTNTKYNGLSLTLIDSLDSLLVFNRTDSFIAAHKYLSSALKKNNDSTKPIFPGFDIDIRVHVFETNIRILGSLLSAHSLCTLPKWKKLFFHNHPHFKYDDEFLTLAQDLGDRLLHAFNTSNSIPFAWINLKHGVLSGETRDTCTAGVGTLMLEMSLLSYLTKNDMYFISAHKALLSLWKLRNVNNNLLGNSFNGASLKWSNSNGGIGAGIDSFYEYLLKSYIYLGYEYYWDIFQISYHSILKYARAGSWYIETNIRTSKPSHFHFNSLQSFWPSLQIMIGDIPLSLSTINSFFSIWYAYNGLPERFLLNSHQPHHSENQYPLRPELIESIFYAYQQSKKDYYLWLGFEILKAIQNRTRTKFGYTILENVVTGDQGDYMPSYFLAETCKYLLLLFDDENVLHDMENDYIFTTEGHILPFYKDMREYVGEVILDKHAGLVSLEEDNGYVTYQEYDEFDGEVELHDEPMPDSKAKIKTNKTFKKKEKNSVDVDVYDSSSWLSIINSANIESIFIYQYGLSAICPSSPFYIYWLMHHNKEGIVYKYNKDIIVDDDAADGNGLWYLWDWIHKMFGKKDSVYKNKQISTIQHDGNIKIGNQCPIPPAKTEKKSDKTEWELWQNNRVRISHDVGHFTVTFIDHSEKLEILNLGTTLIEMSNSVPIHSPYSQYYPYFKSINALKLQHHLNKQYIQQMNDVSIHYLFDTTGPTKYQIRLKSACYKSAVYQSLLTDYEYADLSELLFDGSDSDTVRIKASSAYFSPQPDTATVDEIDREEPCDLERVIGEGILVKAESPSTSCRFPDNLAQIMEGDEGGNNKYIVLTDRGECNFYEKANVLNMESISGIIVGNIVSHSNGNIFTMGSDGIKSAQLPSFMINKLSYNALTHCLRENESMVVQLVEILTRCEEESVSELNVHGINSHFFLSSLSNSGFVVTQNDDIFRLSLPQ